MNYDEAYVGAYVVHPDYRHPEPMRRYGRPAFLDPPLIGVILRTVSDSGRQTRLAHVAFAGIGVREIGIDELTHASRWLIDHGYDSAQVQRRLNDEARPVPVS